MLTYIKGKIVSREYEFSKHAVDQSILRNIAVRELEECFRGEVRLIEHYPADKYGPSCLLLGFTIRKRPIHIQVTSSEKPSLKIITVYEPDRKRWNAEYTHRRANL